MSPIMTAKGMIRRKQEGGEKPKFLAVDFFCGAGGTTRGLIDAGGYVVAGFDKDARCANAPQELSDRRAIAAHRCRELFRFRPQAPGQRFDRDR
jgi:hypothetical protein